MPQEIAGVLPIVQTPFDEAGRIDDASLARQIDWAFEQGADGCGTGMVSELFRLATDERRRLTARLVELVAGRGVFFASVGAESTQQAQHLAREAEQASCHAVMAMPPTLVALSAIDLMDYFTRIAESVSLPLIVQDASGYVGQAIPVSVHVELLERFGPERIYFKPEASPLGPNLSALRDATAGRAAIFEGSGGIFLIDSFRRGVAGTMPAMEMLDGIVAIWRAMQRGDEAAAYHVHFPLASIVALQMQAGLDGFLAIEKYILAKRGIIAHPHRRPPCGWNLDDETAAEVDRLLVMLEDAIDTVAN